MGYAASYNRVSSHYFRTIEIPLLQGRDIAETDSAGKPLVAVINRAMAQRFWPGGGAVGNRFYLGNVSDGRSIQVIGVVANTKSGRLDAETTNFYYLPYQQRYNPQMTLHLRPRGSLTGSLDQTRRTVRELDSALPVLASRSMQESLSVFTLPQRMAAWVAGVMGIMGLMLGAVGIYGVTSFAVAQRTREIGVRLALGARNWEVLALMVRRGITAPLLGMLVGLLAVLGLVQVMPSFLVGSDPIHVSTFGAIALVLVSVALIAVLVPARRAAALDPARTLRFE